MTNDFVDLPLNKMLLRGIKRVIVGLEFVQATMAPITITNPNDSENVFLKTTPDLILLSLSDGSRKVLNVVKV